MNEMHHIQNPGILPDRPFAGDLSGAPRVYVHPQCGAETEMPESVIRLYLAQPFYFVNATRVFCQQCGRHVSIRDVKWVDTNQNLGAYMDQLRAEHNRRQPPVPAGWGAIVGGSLFFSVLGVVIGVAVGGAVGAVIGGVVAFVLIFIVAALVRASAVRKLARMSEQEIQEPAP